jgi:4-hydroxy-tetrahydrodipicolinate reductase
VGLQASCRLIAAGLGWKVEDYRETIEPVIAQHEVSSQFMTVKPGQVAGQHQTATLIAGGKPRIAMDLTMALGAENPRDQIEIDGDPPVNLTVHGGYHGDQSTAAVVVNSIPMVVEAPPGLLTVADFPIPHTLGAP